MRLEIQGSKCISRCKAAGEIMAANEKGFFQIIRSKDGVPCWDGNADTFQEYAEMASHWEQSVAKHKRYSCGPRLQAELTGTAGRFVYEAWMDIISHEGGWQG